MNSTEIRTMDIFCGAGGSSHGAQNAGATIVAGIDMWQPAVLTFRANFPNASVYDKDIRDLCPEEIKEAIGDIDLLLASPECTNHSRAKGNGERSEDSKRTAFEVVRFARVFQPEWIVIENVVEMQEWEGHRELRQNLEEDLKYMVKEVVLNARDFGVPQSRRRLFLLCSRSGRPIPPSNQENSVSVDEVIDKTDKYTFSLLEKPGRAAKTVSTAKRAISTLGEDARFLLVYYGTDRKRGKNGGWQKVTEPLRTVTTLDRFAYVVPDQSGHMMRMLQPEELKLAMGFSSDYKLDAVEGLVRKERVKLMGNGVCPPVMKMIVKNLTGQTAN